MKKKNVFGKKFWGICIALVLVMACVWTAVMAYPNTERAWLDEGPEIEDYDYSFAVVGDTQVVNIKYHDKLVNIYDYICENVIPKNIKYVFSVGDITDTNKDREWSDAYNQIHRLDALVPYNVLRGNHDGSIQINRYFPYSDFANMCGGSYDGKIENTWQTLTVGELDYLIVSLDYGPSDDVLAWASDVIEQHPYHNVIVATHGYLYSDGTLLDQSDGESSAPATSGGYNNGDHIWDKLISKHSNIVLVLCGHIGLDDIMVVQTEGEHGNMVTQMMVNGQDVDNQVDGGAGLVAMLYFSEGGSKVQMEYYSTIRNQWLKASEHEFVELNVIERQSVIE